MLISEKQYIHILYIQQGHIYLLSIIKSAIQMVDNFNLKTLEKITESKQFQINREQRNAYKVKQNIR